jgi:hypothetical protein
MAGLITDVTRRRLLDGLARLQPEAGAGQDDDAFAPARYTGWSGRLDEMTFLSRLYDLEALPSTDDRYRTAGRDIAQHRVLNWDWLDDNWVFTYEPLALADDDEGLLAFLAEMLHRFAEWVSAGVMPALYQAMLDLLGMAGQIDWTRASIDSMHVRALKRGI